MLSPDLLWDTADVAYDLRWEVTTRSVPQPPVDLQGSRGLSASGDDGVIVSAKWPLSGGWKGRRRDPSSGPLDQFRWRDLERISESPERL